MASTKPSLIHTLDVQEVLEEGENRPLVVQGYPYEQNTALAAFNTAFAHQRNMEQLSFYSPYMVFLLLDLFCCPVWTYCGMCGLYSEKHHEYIIGRLSRVVCACRIAFLAFLFGSIGFCIILSNQSNSEYEY